MRLGNYKKMDQNDGMWCTMNKFEEMSSQYLRETYVPDVYQKTIFSIEYSRLKEAGIKLISFDIDDTIVALEGNSIDKATITLFEKLKMMGFSLVMISNNISSKRVQHFSEKLGIDGIARAEKPSVECFRTIIDKYEKTNHANITPANMAHIGNSLLSDIASGNTFGVTTCLVRNVGNLIKVYKIFRPAERELRAELKARGIWVKHHQKERHDQYYQLGECPAYRKDDSNE